MIPRKQPYGSYAQTLLEKVRYNELMPTSLPPYDVAVHYLPGLLGVDVLVHRGELSELELADSVEEPQQSEHGPIAGNGFLVDYRNTQAVRAVAQLLKAQAPLYWLRDSTQTTCGVRLPAGALYVDQHYRQAVKNLPLQIYFPTRAASIRAWQLRQPRLALLLGPSAETDEGWTRFVLEEFGFPYHQLALDNWPSENLSSCYDVIVIADQPSDRLLKALTTTPRSEKERQGLQALHDFVCHGGTLILLNRSCNLAVESWPLGVQNMAPQQEMTVPGSLLNMMIDHQHPLGYGMPRLAAGFVCHSPVFACFRDWLNRSPFIRVEVYW